MKNKYWKVIHDYLIEYVNTEYANNNNKTLTSSIDNMQLKY